MKIEKTTGRGINPQGHFEALGIMLKPIYEFN